MIEDIFALLCLPLASYGLCFTLKDSIALSGFRRFLYRLPYKSRKKIDNPYQIYLMECIDCEIFDTLDGVHWITRFFVSLFDCAFCTGFWSSAGIMAFYCLIMSSVGFWLIPIWAFAGATICYGIDLKFQSWEEDNGD